MNHNSVFTKSAKGVMELTSRSSRLPRDLLKVLKLVDGKSTVRQLAEAAGSHPVQMLSTMEKLEKDGYVKEFTPGDVAPAAVTAGQPSPSRPGRPVATPDDNDDGESLDFTVILKTPILPEQPDPRAEAERKVKAEASRKAREDAERRAREEAQRRAKQEVERRARLEAEQTEREAAERKERELAEQRTRRVAEARKQSQKTAQAAASARSRAQSEAAAVAEARAKADQHAQRVASLRTLVKAAAKPAARVDLLSQAEAAAEAQASALAVAVARARDQVGALAQAAEHARSRCKTLAAAMDPALEPKLNSEITAERDRAERDLQEITGAHAEAQSAVLSLGEAREQALAESRSLAEAKAGARAEAEARAGILAAALSRVKSEAQALKRARTASNAAARKLEDALTRAQDKSKYLAQAKARADAGGLAPDARVQALTDAESCARTQAEALTEAIAQAESLATALGESVAHRRERAGAAEEALAHADDDAEIARLRDTAGQSSAEAGVLAQELETAQERVRELSQARTLAEELARSFGESARHVREEAERKEREEAEREARAEAERREREEAERKARAEAERREREEAERKEGEEAEREAREREEAQRKAEEEARLKAEEEARVKAEEEARLRAEEEARRQEQEEATRRAAQSAPAEEIPLHSPQIPEPEPESQPGSESELEPELEPEPEPEPAPEPEPVLATAGEEEEEADDSTFGRRNRTFMSSVLFLDIAEYSTRPVADQLEQKRVFNELVSNLTRDLPERDRVIVDTGDGAAVSFLGDPEDAYSFAIRLRDDLAAAQRTNPDFSVRVGINLGPVKVVKDMRGQVNLVGDGINDAQRVMSFAQPGQVVVSRTFYDVVTRLSESYAKNFRYQGGRKDKHGKEHMIYEITSAESAGTAATMPSEPKAPAAPAGYDTSGLAALGIDVGADLAIPSQAEVVKELGPSPQELEEERRRDTEDRKKREAEERKRREMEEARARAEAEERARQEEVLRAQAEADRHLWDLAQTRPEVVPLPEPETRPEADLARRARRRKPLRIGRMAGIGLVVVVAAGLGLIHVMPYDFALPQVQQLASARIGDTVKVGSMSGGLFPSPHLTLHRVSVGRDGELSADTVVIPGLSGLMGSAADVSRIEADKVIAKQGALERLAVWNRGAAAAALPLQTIRLTNVRIDVKEPAVPEFNAELSLGADGKVSRMLLNSVDDRISAEIVPRAGVLRIQASARTWRLPAGPDLSFDNLQVKATAVPGRLQVDAFDAILFGGRAQGKGVITWDQGIALAGEADMTSVDAGALLGAYLDHQPVSGVLKMKTSFELQGSELKSLFGDGTGRAEFIVGKGVLNSVDLSRALRSGAREGSRGGQTKFSELAGSLVMNNGRWRFRELRLAAGILSAAGNVEVSGERSLAGHVNVEIQSTANPLRGGLDVTGTVQDPLLRR